MYVPCYIFLFLESRSWKIRSHVPCTVGPGKEDLTSTLGSKQLDHVAALDSSFISCTALDKTLGVRPPDTLIAESLWVVAPGAYLGKLFPVKIIKGKFH